MTPDLLAPLDLAFWNIESAQHPMHLGALGVFSAHSPTAGAHAAELLAVRAAGVPGLRMRIRDVWQPLAFPPHFGSAAREPAPDFEPLDHVRLHAPTADFPAAAGRLMERPLQRGRPPWEAHVLPGEDGTSFAVFFKFHHALADGLRALMLAAALMDPLDLPEPRPRPAEPPRGLLPDVRKLPDLVRGTLSDLGRALDIGSSVARATLGARSSPALTSQPTGTRRIAGVALDLDDVHRVRKSVGGTVNDVLIAVVAGALRNWLDERGDSSAGVAPRALIPVSRRRPRTAHPQGNRLSGYLIRLPVDDPDPLGRLRSVRTAMDANKDAGPNRGAGAVALLADHVPPLGHRLGGPVVGQAARLLFDILVTSVPLPSLGLKLGGCPLTEVYPLAPLARGQALAVAVSTYRGRVHYGLVADAQAVPDLNRLARALTEEVETLIIACGP
ncbi:MULTISPECIES: wax ester/triacylglycerol synthase family O-acyltransferase [Streptomyces]|uniref:Diacylglycerol O-acyltransferase n=1 Tax=Streptomyces mirabilis TaxID=68239 RepID=A0ABU3UF40_9ACTN|nr:MULTISPECIES: wax ester/triacylglycerol synthase family O-acyltransferase [Streptomyces]MCX4613865.1 wax ester/triacylglycerol synthase family O-acyltransferase [Streptomyces mirabilis]MCX5353992.1 wax ester/triacylglycerol synthase family O-acyltransferase [Streptomyces mirabilis]MDU8992435.1 wax ester/triacylglycerol synthase family O-acyltransferase [Streptomyces mirabilis]NMI62689.1 wax ester/triacylglycerol synthase family O-acyltransferase [Streptomyces sp. RLA2-12]QDN61667.1 wax este